MAARRGTELGFEFGEEQGDKPRAVAVERGAGRGSVELGGILEIADAGGGIGSGQFHGRYGL